MNRYVSTLIVTLVSVLLATTCAGGAEPPVRMALVAGGRESAVEQVVDLATAKLGDVDDLVLLERQQIGRILEEHKFQVSGLIDGEQAVELGKLLHVEIFAVVESDPDNKQTFGLVVFDAGSGLRLQDRALAGTGGELTADDIVKAGQAALAKFRRPAKDVRSICVLTVRNADLPRDLDGFCDAIGTLFARQLIASPHLKVLERQRLEHINKERALLNEQVRNDLLTSLVIVELEIGRGQNQTRYRATAFLSESTGKDLDSCESEAVEAADLASALARKVLESLTKENRVLPIDKGREAGRFLREASLWLGHNDFTRALAAAESAYALNPLNRDIQKQLAHSLIMRGLDVLDPGKEGFANLPENPNLTNDDLKLALKLFNRSLQLNPSGPRYAITNVTSSVVGNADVQVNLLYDSFRQLCLETGYRSLENRARQAQKEPGFMGHYTYAVWSNFDGKFRPLFRNSPEYAQAMARIVDRWVAVAASIPPHHIDPRQLEVVASYFSRPIRDPFRRWEMSGDQMLELMGKLAPLEERLNPVERLLARSARIAAESKAGKLSPQEKVARVGELWKQAQQTMDNLPDNQPGWKDRDDRRLCYEAIQDAFGSGIWWRDAPENFEFWLEFLEQMSTRGDVIHEVIWPMKKQIDRSRKGYPRLIKIVNNFLTLLDSPRCRVINGSENVIRTFLIEAGEKIRRSDPTLVQHKLQVPWDDVRVLVDVPNHKGLIGLMWIYLPVLHGRFVYMAALRRANSEFSLEVLRASLDCRPLETVGRVPFPAKGRWDYPDNVLTDLKVHRAAIYIATKKRGIYVFPVDGAPIRQIGKDAGLPSNSVTSLACLDDKLYAAAGDAMGAYLIAVDLPTGKTDVLASSRRKQNRSPFDDSPAFKVKYMVADPDRSRILMVVNSPELLFGLWELDTKTDQFRRRVSFEGTNHHQFSWGSPIREGHILLAAWNWVFEYDLEHNTVTWIYGNRRYNRDHRENEKDNLINGEFNIWPPHLLLDDYLWSADIFGRISIEDEKQELFGQLGRLKQHQYLLPGCLETVDNGGKILYGHRYGLWLLSLRAEDWLCSEVEYYRKNGIKEQ